jgi:hypothetical protein
MNQSERFGVVVGYAITCTVVGCVLAAAVALTARFCMWAVGA